MEEKAQSIHELLSKAEEARQNKDNVAAIELYKDILKTDPLQIPAYDDLMKIYRQQKAYKKELEIINSGIKVYDKFYNEHSGNQSKEVKAISEKLNKSFGLVDKKGHKLYNPEPIARWQKRKKVVTKKLAK